MLVPHSTDIHSGMPKVRQIDYITERVLYAYSGKYVVRLTGEETRYQFSGELIEEFENEFTRIGDVRNDWQKSAFPVPWTDSPYVVHEK